MLTDEEKERIRQEEIFRSEVRITLNTPNDPRQRVWKFLNSPLGLWILSSIVVASLTWGFSNWQTSALEAAKRLQLIKRLDTEIVFRLRSGEKIIESAKTKEQLYLAIITINGGTKHLNFDFGVFPEFRSRSMQSLLYELSSVVDKNVKPTIDGAVLASWDLQDVFLGALNLLSSTTGIDDQTVDEQERTSLMKLLSKFSKERWKR